MSQEQFSSAGPVCPYCENVETPDDPSYYDESATTMECGDCGATYAVQVFIDTSWSTKPLPMSSGSQP